MLLSKLFYLHSSYVLPLSIIKYYHIISYFKIVSLDDFKNGESWVSLMNRNLEVLKKAFDDGMNDRLGKRVEPGTEFYK